MELLVPSLKLANLEWPHFTRASWPTWQGKHLNDGMALKFGLSHRFGFAKTHSLFYSAYDNKLKYSIP